MQKNFFKQIISLKENINEQINLLIQESYLNVNERMDTFPYYTIVGQLALLNSDGRYNQHIESLIENGAWIDDVPFVYASQNDPRAIEYLANLDEMISGYAFGAHHEKVTRFLSQDESLLPKVLYGYALAQNNEKIDYYLGEYFDVSLMHYYPGIKEGSLVYSYDDLPAQYLYDATIQDPSDKMEVITAYSHILMGYALAGIHEKVVYYLDQFLARHIKEDNALTIIFGFIISGYALAGNHNKVNDYLTHTRNHLSSYVLSAIYGYICACNDKKVQELFKRYHPKLNEVTLLYQTCGRPITADRLLGAVDNYFKLRDKEYITSRRRPYHYFFLSSCFGGKRYDEKKKAIIALKLALIQQDSRLSIHLPILNNGRLAKVLKCYIQSGEASRFVFQEVNTITEFIQALELKNTTLLQESINNNQP